MLATSIDSFNTTCEHFAHLIGIGITRQCPPISCGLTSYFSGSDAREWDDTVPPGENPAALLRWRIVRILQMPLSTGLSRCCGYTDLHLILVPLIRDRPTKLRATSCGGDRASQAARSGAGRSMNLRGRGGGFTDRGRAEQMEESMQLRLLIRRHANQFHTELFLPQPADDGKVPAQGVSDAPLRRRTRQAT